jgi:hypothetical protein
VAYKPRKRAAAGTGELVRRIRRPRYGPEVSVVSLRGGPHGLRRMAQAAASLVHIKQRRDPWAPVSLVLRGRDAEVPSRGLRRRRGERVAEPKGGISYVMNGEVLLVLAALSLLIPLIQLVYHIAFDPRSARSIAQVVEA